LTAEAAIPETPEDVTAEWLTDALAGAFPGARVSSVAVLEQHSGTTGRVRLAVSYAPGPAGPASVFVKLAPFTEAQRQLVAMTNMGRQEARFYAGPAAETPVRVPRAYFAAAGEKPTDYVMVLEDVAAAGCTFPAGLDAHAEQNGSQLIASLARLHAHFWNDPRFGDELRWVKPFRSNPLGAQLIESALSQFAKDLPPVFTQLGELYAEHWERITTLWGEGEQTLIHGDTHAGNQFLDGEVVGLYDWAVISRSPGIRDIAIYLGNSCPTELRRRRQEEWIRLYRQTLVESGVDAPSYEQLWLRYRLGVLYAWVAATTTAAMGSTWQPIEIGMHGMRVSTAACGDLQTLEAFQEVL
jgi:hypothetical protein